MAETTEENLFQIQLKRAMRYIDNGHSKFLDDNIGEIVGHKTIETWKSPKREPKISPKKIAFTSSMAQVPDYSLNEKVKLYGNILENASLTRESQKSLFAYDGKYKIVLPIGCEYIEESFFDLTIKVFTKPVFVGFSVGYKIIKEKQKTHPCDGMIFSRGSKVYLIGTAKETTLIGHFVAGEHIDRRPVYGTMTFECIAAKVFRVMRFALVRIDANQFSSVLKEAQEQLAKMLPQPSLVVEGTDRQIWNPPEYS